MQNQFHQKKKKKKKKKIPITKTNPSQTHFTKLNSAHTDLNPGPQFTKFTSHTNMTWVYCKKNNLPNSKKK